MCGVPLRRAAAQETSNSTTRLTPTTIEISSGYSYLSKWNASIARTLTKMQFANIVIGANIVGPYDNYIRGEEPKPDITLWGASLGVRLTDWQNKWKGTGIDGTVGCGNREKGKGNPLWNYGFQATVNRSLYTDREGKYAFAVGYQFRLVYVVDNDDKNGVAFATEQKETSINSVNVSVFF
jgi:hypothetical protein